jgi:DNA polymerase (family X)
MTNSAIADNFSLLSKLMDIHGQNSFKSKSYSIAAFTIEKLQVELSTMPHNKIFVIKGIGESVGQKIIEQLTTNKLEALNKIIEDTPAGIIEMLQNIKGLGPKKIATIWTEMNIESIGELLYACNENRLTLFKGFGEKTQLSVKQSIEFYLNTLGSYLYAQIESYALLFTTSLQQYFANDTLQLVGNFLMQNPVIDSLEWATTVSQNELHNFFITNGYQLIEKIDSQISFKGTENVLLVFYMANKNNFINVAFKNSCSLEFYDYFTTKFSTIDTQFFSNEAAIFSYYNIQYIEPSRRDSLQHLDIAIDKKLPNIIVEKDIKGIIHSHSKWSDGSNSLLEMATAAQKIGYQYLVISDHSKTASYAQGLQVEQVLAQHQQINEINKTLFPFKIFKSIESDILGNGSLDYEGDILQQFDLVIASIHSNLAMQQDKAMQRLLAAIENPYTTILGHLTGRLLLSRNGYPIDIDKIIDACAANNVAIELNAHPRRLDIDWTFINKALDKNVLISINPDAHSIEGFSDCKYGVLAAQKTMLSKQKNVSSFDLQEFERFLQTHSNSKK